MSKATTKRIFTTQRQDAVVTLDSVCTADEVVYELAWETATSPMRDVETFVGLPVALMRLAGLVKGIETQGYFTDGFSEFVEAAESFLAAEVVSWKLPTDEG